jgi:MFS family permease
VNSIDHPPGSAAGAGDAELAVVRKTAWKLLPIMFLGYVVACLDRSNIGVAALTMMSTLGLNAAQFGFAAGVFFVGYAIGCLPSNLLQVRYGARRWLGRILILWGIVACAMALVVGPHSLYGMRFALGITEAGFVPGAIVYLAFWFPPAFRARTFAIFTMGVPASMVLGTPLSTGLLYMDGIWGLHGWQWLYVVEGVPAVLLGLAVLRYLPSTPREAPWLDDRERDLLLGALQREQQDAPVPHGAIRAALMNRRTWQMGLTGIGLAASSFGVIFFMPLIIAEFGGSHLKTGLLSTLPFIVALVAMFYWTRHSDRTGERRLHIAIGLGLAMVGLLGAAVASSLPVKCWH